MRGFPILRSLGSGLLGFEGSRTFKIVFDPSASEVTISPPRLGMLQADLETAIDHQNERRSVTQGVIRFHLSGREWVDREDWSHLQFGRRCCEFSGLMTCTASEFECR